jgi:UPF0716 protein FxsA
MRFWFLAFFLTPIVEMYLLIRVGGYIGALPTICLVMLTAVIGVVLLRIQGFATLTRGLGRLQSGQIPAREVAEGVLLAVAGALLLTPGFVTDTLGFLLLFPPTRAAVARRMLDRVVTLSPGAAGPGGVGPGPGGRFRPGWGPDGRADDPSIIEGEFESHDDPPGAGPTTPRGDGITGGSDNRRG